MNNRISLPRNPLRISTHAFRALSKENRVNKYKIYIPKAIRLPSHKPFRNITNMLMLPPLQDEKEDPKRSRNLITDKSIIDNSYFIKQSNPNNTVILVDLKKKCTDIPTTNPQECSEYVQEINSYLKLIETKHQPIPNYMDQQQDINNRMRSILIDWLIDVHIRFKLLPETLFLTVNIIDRYLSKEKVKKEYLQLVGVGSLLIGAKYEEIYSPEVNDFVYITDNAFSREQVISMEQKILRVLEFNLNVPSSNRYLQIFAKKISPHKNVINLGQYFLELSLVKESAKLKPSEIAASALFAAKKVLKEDYKLTTGYREDQLEYCIKDMIIMAQEAPKATLQAVRKKFSNNKYMKVSEINFA